MPQILMLPWMVGGMALTEGELALSSRSLCVMVHCFEDPLIMHHDWCRLGLRSCNETSLSWTETQLTNISREVRIQKVEAIINPYIIPLYLEVCCYVEY